MGKIWSLYAARRRFEIGSIGEGRNTMTNRSEVLSDIVQRLLTIHEKKHCEGICPPMVNGVFFDETCYDCEYLFLTNEINKLKNENPSWATLFERKEKTMTEKK
jgi:hypothetical protein